MSRDSMLVRTVYLEPQPGEIFPVLRLKHNTTSLRIKIQVAPRDVLTDYTWKPCVIKATLPDGTAFFATSGCNIENRRISAWLYAPSVRQMTSQVGRYKATLTIIDTDDPVNRENYMNYDIQTVLPFTVIIEKQAEEG